MKEAVGDGMDFLIQAPRRCIGDAGTVGVGGVIGLELRGPGPRWMVAGMLRLVVVRERGDGLGVAGRGLAFRGAENADPMSERVSERTRIRSEGAMAGTWWEGEGGGLLMSAGDEVLER